MINTHYGILETETFSLDQNFVFKASTSVSGTGYVQAAGDGLASMSTTVTGTPGLYDLVVYYWDENDGKASSTVKIDGATVDSWVWSKNLGSPDAGAATYTTRVIRDVTLDEAATITVEGRRDGREPLRIDKIMLQPAESRDLNPGLKAFDGAEGFGTDTPGGRGGWIVKVTNLDDSGVGSLRWALQELDVPRIVVFEVGGLITLKSEIFVKGDVTVAGQTAPGDGVTIRGAKLQVVDDNVIIRGLKIRPGDGPGQEFQFRDAISIGTAGKLVKDVVIDSNSFSWATDETVTVWNGASNVTVSNNIIAEALDLTSTQFTEPSFGMLIGDRAHHVSVVGNLFASNEFRNPTISSGYAFEMVNNLVYNYAQHGLSVNTSKGDAITVHAIGNVFDKGATTGIQKAVRINGAGDGTKVYLRDNLSPDRIYDTEPDRLVAAGSLRATIVDKPIFASDVTAMAARDVRAHVLDTVGARAQGLDSVDSRILGYVADGGGGLIQSQSQVGGYNTKTTFSTLADTDGDGIPDYYESLLGSDRDVFDPHGDVNGDGYSNIENYINGLISGVFTGPEGAPAPLFIEAESLKLVRGFVRETNSNASGGAVIKGGFAANAQADATFTNSAGRYDITVGYADENDGASRLAVVIDGVKIDEWIWNAKLGSSLAAPGAFTEHVIGNVALTPGQTISLIGQGDGGEPLRVDSIQFTPVESIQARSPAGGVESVTPPTPVRIEAETMTLLSGFAQVNLAMLSGGSMIQAKPSSQTARAQTVIDAPAGAYNVAIRHSDESDGVAWMEVLLNGARIDAWSFNKTSGGPLMTDASLIDRVIPNIVLNAGDVLELAGNGVVNEPLRIDYIDLTPVDGWA